MCGQRCGVRLYRSSWLGIEFLGHGETSVVNIYNVFCLHVHVSHVCEGLNVIESSD